MAPDQNVEIAKGNFSKGKSLKTTQKCRIDADENGRVA
jgi:hypothetical protein